MSLTQKYWMVRRIDLVEEVLPLVLSAAEVAVNVELTAARAGAGAHDVPHKFRRSPRRPLLRPVRDWSRLVRVSHQLLQP